MLNHNFTVLSHSILICITHNYSILTVYGYQVYFKRVLCGIRYILEIQKNASSKLSRKEI